MKLRRSIGTVIPLMLAVVVSITSAGCGMAGKQEPARAAESAKTAEAPVTKEEAKAEEPKMNEPGPSAGINGLTLEKKKRGVSLQDLGGLLPANGQKYDDMYFKHYGVNPFVTVGEEPVSTFSADVDTASYTIARNFINKGSLPPEDAVRVEEFINYFRQDYPIPVNDTFNIYTESGPSRFGDGYHLVQVGLQGRKIEAEERKAASLTFVIDVSGSMARENRLELVKRSLKVLVDQMDKNDRIGIAVYGTNGRKLLSHTSGDNKESIMEAVNNLQPEGSTNASEGLQAGYEMASGAFIRGGINRIILCTDGVANQGLTKAEDILKLIGDYKDQGIYLTALGFGMGNYNDVLIEKLADKGNGNYGYIDTFEEAKRMFLEQLTGTLQVIAKDVKAQVEFNPEKVERYRLIGYENRRLNEEDFRNDKVDAGEIGSGHTVTALYEVKLRDQSSQDVGIVRIRYKNPDSDRVMEMSKRISSWETGSQFTDATPRFKLSAAVAEFAEILRGSYWAQGSSLQQVLEVLEEEGRNLDLYREDQELMELVRKAAGLKKE